MTVSERSSTIQRYSKNFENKDLISYLEGKIPYYFPRNEIEYKQYRSLLHDVFMNTYVQNLSFSHPYKPNTGDPILDRQEPDLFKVENNVLFIIECTVSKNVQIAFKDKRDKYFDLINTLREKNEYDEVIFEVCILEYRVPNWMEREEFNHMQEWEISLLQDLIRNLNIYETSPEGRKFLQYDEGEDIDLRVIYQLDRERKLQELADETGTTVSDDVRLLLGQDFFQPVDLTEFEEEYMLNLAKIACETDFRRPFPSNKYRDTKGFKLESEAWTLKVNSTCTCDNKTVFPFPYLDNLEIENKEPSGYLEELRKLEPETELSRVILESIDLDTMTIFDNNFVDPEVSVDELLNTTEDPSAKSQQWILNNHKNKILKVDTNGPFRHELLEAGVGRKKYNQDRNIVRETPPTSVRISGNQELEFAKVIEELSKSRILGDVVIVPKLSKDNGSLNLVNMSEKISKVLNDHPALHYSYYCSKLSREFILNGTRRRKSKEILITHTGFKGLYLILLPGQQLRTGSGQVFFKLISMKFNNCRPVNSPWFKEWREYKSHFESQPLSMDLDRLNWLARSAERISISFLSMMEQSFSKMPQKNNFLTFIKEELISSDSLYIMASIFLENRSITSQFIQTTRYFLMKSIGDRKFDELWSKLPTRICSSLHSLLMSRFMNSLKILNSNPQQSIIRQRSLKIDDDGNVVSNSGGVESRLPRLFSKGRDKTIDWQLNEIYFCMFYEKDRQNKVLDQMGILKKILSEEKKMDEELLSRMGEKGFNHLFGIHDVEEDYEHVRNWREKESHYYSSRATLISSKLQSVHKQNSSGMGTWAYSYDINSILNTTIDKFATFKASVIDIARELEDLEIETADQNLQNRTKCIDNVMRLLEEENLLTIRDVVDYVQKKSKYEVLIQIFKKNQIGGVREIIILEIVSRIMINFAESLARKMAQADERELLTKGKDKKQLIKEDYHSILQHFAGEKINFIFNSYDCSTWCQKFIPTIFLSLFRTNQKLNPVKDLLQEILISHCLKKIEYPKEMLKQWILHPDIEHSEDYMQYYKDKFLRDRIPYFVNVSNMCQGILHYQSTCLATYKLSFRDYLFSKCLEILDQEKSIEWKSRVGSDDHGDMIGFKADDKQSFLQVQLLDRCLAISELLHSIDLSVKSSSSFFVYEVNQNYMFNYDCVVPIVKFAHNSVTTHETSSLTEFVHSSYSSIRQLRENGATSLITGIAHEMNKLYATEIFSLDGENSPETIFKIKESEAKRIIPFDFGLYPIYDYDMMELAGPELYNYIVYKNTGSDNIYLRTLFSTMDDTLAEFKEDSEMVEESYFKREFPKISRGINSLWIRMKERFGASPDQVEEEISKDITIMFRQPESIEEAILKCKAILVSPGSDKSLRRTSPGISYSRLGAFKTARAWKIDVASNYLTYSECLRAMVDLGAEKPFNPKIAFPHAARFEVYLSYMNDFGYPVKIDKPLMKFSRKLSLCQNEFRYKSSIGNIVKELWTKEGSPFKVSKIEMMKFLSLSDLFSTSLETTIDNCKKNRIRPTTLMYYAQRVLKGYGNKFMECFISSRGTTQLSDTIEQFKIFNHYPGMKIERIIRKEKSIVDKEMISKLSSIFDPISIFYNMLVMKNQGSFTNEEGEDIDFEKMVKENIFYDDNNLLTAAINSINTITDSSWLNTTRRKILFVVTGYISQLLNEPEVLAEKSLELNKFGFSWLLKQKRVGDQWSGPFSLMVQYAREIAIIHGNNLEWSVDTPRINDDRNFIKMIKFGCSKMGEGMAISEKILIRDKSSNDFKRYRIAIMKKGRDEYFVRGGDIKKNPSCVKFRLNTGNFDHRMTAFNSGNYSSRLVEENGMFKVELYTFDGRSRKVDIVLESCPILPVSLDLLGDVGVRSTMYYNGVNLKTIFQWKVMKISSVFDFELQKLSPLEIIQDHCCLNTTSGISSEGKLLRKVLDLRKMDADFDEDEIDETIVAMEDYLDEEDDEDLIESVSTLDPYGESSMFPGLTLTEQLSNLGSMGFDFGMDQTFGINTEHIEALASEPFEIAGFINEDFGDVAGMLSLNSLTAPMKRKIKNSDFSNRINDRLKNVRKKLLFMLLPGRGYNTFKKTEIRGWILYLMRSMREFRKTDWCYIVEDLLSYLMEEASEVLDKSMEEVKKAFEIMSVQPEWKIGKYVYPIEPLRDYLATTGSLRLKDKDAEDVFYDLED